MRVRTAVGLAVSVALLVALLRVVDPGAVAATLARTRLAWVAVAVVLAPLGLYARAVRWRYLFPPGRAPRDLASATMIGYMVNNVVPLRAGEVVRVYLAGRDGRFWTALSTVAVERVLDVTTLLLLLGGVALVMPVPPYVAWGAALLLAANVVAIAVLVVLVALPDRARRLVARVLGRWPALRDRALGVVAPLLEGFVGVRAASHAVPLLVTTALCWLLPAAVVWSVLRAVGLALPWPAPWLTLAFLGLGISVPSAPGFVGVFHAAAGLAVAMFGVPMSQAVGFAVVLHAVQFVPVTAIGWVLLVRRQLTLRSVTAAGAASVSPAGAVR